MRKSFFLNILVLLIAVPSWAAHISGGEVFYEYLGPGTAANSDKFKITLRLFRDCAASGANVAQMPTQVTLGIFTRTGPSSYVGFQNVSVTRARMDQMSITPSAYPCLQPVPPICYQVGYFEITMDLPRTQLGYQVAFQTCCRTAQIVNIQYLLMPENNTVNEGATYVANIPGTALLNTLTPDTTNSSPQFPLRDTALICANNDFTLNFGASDKEKDSLVYSFCSAYNRGNKIASEDLPPTTPPFNFITYAGGFSGNSPLGSTVTIDPKTGVISGIAPNEGKYVMNICIDEYRKGVKISEHRKDFLLEVKSCNIAGATLQPSFITCDGYNLSFQNLNTNASVNSWYWDFGVPSLTNDTSILEKPTFSFPDSGTFTIKLITNKGQACPDSATAIAKVYPGFFPGFTVSGSCVLNPFQFTDTTKTRYGVVNKWSWNFGDESSTADISTLQNPTWKYSSIGMKTVNFIVENSKGCIDTVTRAIEIKDKPTIAVPFKDTLICSIDTLQLGASSTGPGVYSWQPGTNILNANTATPLVFPKTTTTYDVTINDNGCTNTESIQVRVVDFVTLNAGPDTTICLTDSLTLNPSGDGLAFSWTPVATLDNPNVKNPIALPVAPTTTYTVVASIGKCNTSDNVTVSTVPYPQANVDDSTIICYGDTTQLSGSIVGSAFTWSPTATLLNANTLTPLAFPLTSTNYILSVTDVLGCPKPFKDTILVIVRNKIIPFAGNDTSVVVNQPLQLNASGGMLYTWTPATFLTRGDIQSPIARFSSLGEYTYIMKAYTPEDCFAYDTIRIKVFDTYPQIFVPTAFTPGKSTNKYFKPIPVGISILEYFRVYNRWGQLVYSSIDPKAQGWDGKVNGKDQDTGTYVWMVQGKDYTGKTVFKKGTMILIR